MENGNVNSLTCVIKLVINSKVDFDAFCCVKFSFIPVVVIVCFSLKYNAFKEKDNKFKY